MTKISHDRVVHLFSSPKACINLNLAQWSAFIFILRDTGLLARFCYFAQQQPCYDLFPDKVKQHLNSAKIKADRQAKQAQFEAFEMHKNLTAINVTPIFLKGVAYTLRHSVASKGRMYSDMDILVPKAQLLPIEKKLSMYGWFGKKVDDYDDKYYRQWAHEIPPLQQASRGTVADIHHNLLPPISGRAPNIDVFTRNLHKTDDGFYTLNKPAMVMHSIIHLFFNEEYSNGFRDLSDLDLMFTEELENHSFWQALIKLSEQSNFKVELFYATRYCQAIFNTQFPSAFLSSLVKLEKNRLTLADFIFKRVLLPQHPSCSGKYSYLANSLATIRGHWLKMPLHILIYHSLHKSFDSTMKIFFKQEKT